MPDTNIVEADRASLRESDGVASVQDQPTDFQTLTEKALSRRGFLGAGVAFGATAFVMGSSALTPFSARAAGRLTFDPVAANTLDTITLPKGYSWHVALSWGDPLWSKGKAFDESTRGTGESQELAMGDNNDGMAMFTQGSTHVLAVNNEYTNVDIIHGNRASKKPENADDVRKSKAAHGITIAEMKLEGGKWSVVKDSKYNRRITADTPMDITGLARGHDLMKTAADPSGTKVLGTFNNCGNGRTPWGTYLTCEENFNGLFASSDANFKPSDALNRYGIGLKSDYGWIMADERFDISKHPNEGNRHGYIVEIDPFDPASTPKKRTALGRFKHENVEVVIAGSGQAVAYMGDDERGEFIYKFVSDGRYAPGGNNSELLATGKLYVAKFADDGKGEWIELTPAATGMASQAEILVNTRQAGSKVKATTMDRPEWVSAHPSKAEVYCCLTNNSNRGVKPNAGGDDTPVGGPNPRKANNYGQIVRWRPDGGDHLASGIAWDLFVTGGNPNVHSDAYAGSKNITKENTFNSPDGLAFDSTGLLWIQTDGNYSNAKDYEGQGNNQMLVGDPETGDIRRFMVGPRQAEVTGITWSADKKTLFVGIQHPGEDGGDSHFPNGGSSVARSSVIAITKDDGGLMG